MNRTNPQVEVPEDYFRITIFIPYLDSLISSLETWFSEGNKPAYNLLMLHPFRMANVERQTFKKHMIVVKDFYDFDNLIEESETWYDVWKNKCQNGLPKKQLEKMTLTDVYGSTEFYPSIRMAIQTALALPVSTCTIERSFSTLRRVKTWLRSTTGDEHLSGLCMLSVHRNGFLKTNQTLSTKLSIFLDRNHGGYNYLFQDWNQLNFMSFYVYIDKLRVSILVVSNYNYC